MPVDQLFTSAGKMRWKDYPFQGERPLSELAQFVVDIARPVGGWRVFHTATCAPYPMTVNGVKYPQWRRSRSPWEFVDRYERFMHRPERKDVSWFLAVEPNPDHSRFNSGFHGHALWTEGWGSVTWNGRQWWYERHGDNRFRLIDRLFVPEIYCSKYLVKDANHLCVWEVAGALYYATTGGKSV